MATLELLINSSSSNKPNKAKIKFKMAGNILGSAYVEIDLTSEQSETKPKNILW